MKKNLRAENGFTLLELIISMAIIAVIVGIALGGMKFGISAREVGDQKTEIYQRLRFIGEQISSKTRSLHPLFIQLTPVLTDATQAIDAKKMTPLKLLAFEGLEHSIRFITFADSLSVTKKNRWLHEVAFYLGEHPYTRESGIIMMEQELLFDDAFITPNPETTQYIMLAKDVSYLRFRYYKSRKLSAEELKAQKDNAQNAQNNKPILYIDEWATEIPLTYTINIDQSASEPGKPPAPVVDQQSKISTPRAIEISIGLKEQQIPGKTEEPGVIYLPPMIVPLNAGTQITRPPLEVKNEKT